MESLSMLDAGFLEAEDSDHHVSLAIGSVSVLEGPIPDDDAFMSGLAERVLAVPRFRQVLRTHPLDLQAPEWVDAKNFDISHHVHRVAIPHPYDDAALFRLTADVMERRLDRERPLWECWIVEGLPDNRWAMIMKLHHCIADGIATMHMLAGLSDGGEGDTYATEIRAASEPAQRGFRLPQLSVDPRQWVDSMWHTSTALLGGATRALSGAIEIAGGLLRPTPTSLVGSVATMRRYVAAEVSLDDVAHVCHTFDVTINDVALAAITDAYRAVLIRRGEKPQRNSLRTLVPVSVRSNDAVGKVDNRVSLMLPYLPVEKSDPEDQLQTVHRRLTQAKHSGQRQAGHVLISAANIIPFPLTAWAVRAATRLPQRGVVTVATNVPGPRQQMQVMGRKVVRMFPIPPIALGLRTGIAIVSYADKLVFGITGDYDTAPDVDDLARGIERAVERLVAVSTPAGRSKKERQLS
jgi:diacylglycerol O-acyltransferase / wax synthase